MSACPECGRDNPEGFQFCGYCTAPLTPTPEGRSDERKVVSVLFCDVVGFTSSSEQADPEDVQRRMQPYYARLRREIEGFGGTVEKFIGDAVMAVFGAPVAHEDDAERAVRAGMRILEAIAELNEDDPGLDLSVRIGVNTGEVVVTHAATPDSGEAAVLGDAVNTAARIQSAAPVGGVAVGEGTYRATERIFEYEALDPIEAKGKAHPVSIWQAGAPRARFGSDVIRSLTTPLVGRETDLLLLRGTFDKSARERSTHLVTIVGEPGLGKSRLVAELFAYIEGLPDLITWRQGRCLPYGDGITFWALGEIVKAHAGIFESDEPGDAEKKLERVLPEGEEAPWFRARLLPLLGIESGTEGSREESFTAWRRFIEGIAEDGPLVVVVEDLHWADDALLDFLEHVADWAHGVPLLLLCTTRPELLERRPSWASGLRNATTIGLSQLSAKDTAQLVSALLDQAVLPAETQQLILRRAGGNPLYAEEFVHMLHDRGLLDSRGTLRAAAEIPVPDSIHALIAARLDALTSDAKALLQDAAVVGKVFWSNAVAVMGERDLEHVEGVLHVLARKELVRPSRQSSMEGEREFGFWHILVRDVAYGQIPRAERARKHRHVGAWIEEKAGGRVEDLSEVLAYHAGEAISLAEALGDQQMVAELAPSARRFAFLAGERALELDTSKALKLFGRALELTPEDDPEHAWIQARWASAAQHAGRHRDAVVALTRASGALRENGELERAAEVLLNLAIATQHTGDMPSEQSALEEALSIAETLGPGRILVETLGRLATTKWIEGEHEQALGAAERALAIAAQLDLPAAYPLGARGLVRCELGEANGLADIERAIRDLTARGEGRSAAMLRNNFGYVRWAYEGPSAAIDAFGDAERFAEQRGMESLVHVAACSRVGALVEAGRLDEGIRAAAEVLALAEETGSLFTEAEASAVQARALAEQGRMAGAEPLAERAVTIAREMRRDDEFLLAALAASTVAASRGHSAEVEELLGAILALPNIKASGEYGARLPALVRCAVGCEKVALAESLVDGIEPTQPIRAHGLVAARALLAEARGDLGAAAEGFAHAALRWEAFDAVLEHAYALLGQARCLAALDEAGSDAPARRARALFDRMGARPRVAACDGLIARASALSS